MFQNLYTIFIAPKRHNEDDRNREMVLNVLLSSTLMALILSLPIFLYNYFFLGKGFALGRMLWIVMTLVIVATIYRLSRTGRYRIAAFLLVLIYFLIGCLIVASWGITTPVGLLIFGLVTVLAGILLGPRHSLYAAAAVIALLSAIHAATTKGLLSPDLSWTVAQPEIGDLIAFSLIFCLMAVVSWLFNRQMERSLLRAERAEAALTKQKNLLETTVEERTRELQTTQLEKIQQMYRFAELGQLSTALLHELSNHLTTLTLDIEGLKDQGRSRVLSRAKRSIHYIDDMVVRVRDQLHGKSSSRPFNIVDEVDAVVKMLRHKAQAHDVILKWEPPADKKFWRARGEPIRLRQLIANLISNGIDAYYESRDFEEKRDVQIELAATNNSIIITVADWGRGISERDQSKMFEPFFSTKQTGMGMGLYIAKQIAEEHFLGTIKIDSSQKNTVFVVTLPKADR